MRKFKFFVSTFSICPLILFSLSSNSFAADSGGTSNDTGVLLVCQSLGSAYSKQISQAASDALIAAGATNFRVRASLKLNGTRPTKRLANNLVPAGLITATSKDPTCHTNANSTTVCKGGYEATFKADGVLPNVIEPCLIPKELTLVVRIGRSVNKTVQNVNIPGVFIHLRTDSSSSNETGK